MEQSCGQCDTACTGGSAGARTQGAGEGAADAGARVKQHVRGGAEWELERHELGSAGARVLESRCKRWSGRNVGGTERVARACARWRAGVGGVGKCWAAGAEWTHGHEQVMLECDVSSNGTRRMSCGGKLLREMQERDGHIKDAAQVFDKMPIRVVLENARVLLLGEASRVQDVVGRILRRCADAARQGRGDAGPADEEEEEQQHEVVEAETVARI
jgi:hypothetical protein